MLKGILGKKLGMTQRFSEDGTLHAITVIQAGPCTVTQVKTLEKDGYQAVQIGYGDVKRISKPMKGHFGSMGPFRHLREFRVDDLEGVERGARVEVTIFEPGDKVDVTGVSKGKGFAGVVKRHHFSGGPKTHGQSDRHRAPGSVGAGTTPGRVTKGFRMAGHMGNRRVTARKLTVLAADQERGLLLIKGAVPGALNGLVVVRKSEG
ncbi:MAG: 50S ribosomal protein L3 [Chloroflexi bacterium]|nr:50S ribosomal protein L3 [Chloroflexota bacterium]